MLIIKFSAEQTACAIYLDYFCTKSDFRANFRQLMEQLIGSGREK